MEIETPRRKVIQDGKGKATIEWNPNFGHNWNNKFNNTQKFIDSECLRLMDPYISFKSGMLKQSGILGSNIGSGMLEYTAIYARYQYYGKVMVGKAPKRVTNKNLVYTGGPMRGSYFFERMKNDHKQEILKNAAKMAGGNI